MDTIDAVEDIDSAEAGQDDVPYPNLLRLAEQHTIPAALDKGAHAHATGREHHLASGIHQTRNLRDQYVISNLMCHRAGNSNAIGGD